MSAAGDALRKQADELTADADECSRQIDLLLGKRDYARHLAAKLRNAARDADEQAERTDNEGNGRGEA